MTIPKTPLGRDYIPVPVLDFTPTVCPICLELMDREGRTWDCYICLYREVDLYGGRYLHFAQPGAAAYAEYSARGVVRQRRPEEVYVDKDLMREKEIGMMLALAHKYGFEVVAR